MEDRVALIRKIWRSLNRARWGRQHLKNKQKSLFLRSKRYHSSEKVSRADLVRSLKLLEPSKQPMNPILDYFGAGGDGSYMVPRLLHGQLDVLISPGVGLETHFDELMAKRGTKVILVDGTLTSPPPQHKNFTFVPKNIGPHEHEVTLDRLIEEFTSSNDTIGLQIDIEGAEYAAFAEDSLSGRNLEQFIWLVVEFHNLHLLGIKGVARESIDKTLNRLNDFFLPVHLNVNNAAFPLRMFDIEVPEVVEVTYVNRRRLSEFHLSEEPSGHRATLNDVRLPPVSWPQLNG